LGWWKVITVVQLLLGEWPAGTNFLFDHPGVDPSLIQALFIRVLLKIGAIIEDEDRCSRA